MKNALLVFAAACIGGLFYCLSMWLSSRYGLTQTLGVNLHGSISPQWMYPRIVWSGLWGLLFLLPILTSRLFVRSFVVSLIPTCVQLFIIYPFYTSRGFAGLELGLLTPVLVWFFYWVWALTTLIVLRFAR